MTLISDLQKTIALLTAKLERYEQRDELLVGKVGSGTEIGKSTKDHNQGNESATTDLTCSPTSTGLSNSTGSASVAGSTATSGANSFAVNFGTSGSSSFTFGTNQGQTYRNALSGVQANKSHESMGNGNLKWPHQLRVPQPGYDPRRDRNNVAFYKSVRYYT